MKDKTEIQTLVVTCRRLDRLHGGSALRNWQNVCGLSKLGPVDVITVGPTDQPSFVSGVRHYEHIPKEPPSRGVSGLWRKRWLVDPTAHPMVNLLYQNSVVSWINQRCRTIGYDVAVVEELVLARYLGDLNRRSCFTIFDAHNVESKLSGDMAEGMHRNGWSSAPGKWKRDLMDRRLATAEREHAMMANRIWACSNQDKEGFHRLVGESTPIDVIPNSIDVDAYTQPERIHESEDWRAYPLVLTYLGAYSYFPNEQAALELIDGVLPILRERGIKAKVQLIGGGVTPAMTAAAGDRQDVEITGPVDSILPYLRERSVIVLPIRLGGGTRLKILEAFASSRPVISTAKGAEGIEVIDGCHLLLRESTARIAEAAVNLWNDATLRQELCRNALQLVADHYSHESAGQLICQSVLSAMHSSKTGSA